MRKRAEDGREVSEGVGGYTVDRIISSMVGKGTEEPVQNKRFPMGETLLEVKGDLLKRVHLEDISFRTSKGEILGLAGLEGCGE